MRASSMPDDLQRLKQKLEPVVFGQEVLSLPEGYVPRGPETGGFEPDTASRTAACNAATGTDAPVPGDKDDWEDTDVHANRYSGVIYAARFFVTRVGFLRSVKRCV